MPHMSMPDSRGARQSCIVNSTLHTGLAHRTVHSPGTEDEAWKLAPGNHNAACAKVSACICVLFLETGGQLVPRMMLLPK
jgi:hypothetical protein